MLTFPNCQLLRFLSMKALNFEASLCKKACKQSQEQLETMEAMKMETEHIGYRCTGNKNGEANSKVSYSFCVSAAIVLGGSWRIFWLQSLPFSVSYSPNK